MNKLLGDIGTIEWTRRTQGLLTVRERARFVAAVLLVTARAVPRLLLARAGVWGRGPDPSSFVLPDTAFAREVLSACADLHPVLLEHSIRSYLFARALAETEGVRLDDEALLAATLLHDSALPELTATADASCFTLRCAERAEALLRTSPLSAALRHDVLDAITLHLNPFVSPEQGSLQRLTHAGVLLDVTGARAWDLDRSGVARVLERHPPTGLSQQGVPRLAAHAARVPRSRSSALVRCGLLQAVRLHPFAHDQGPPSPLVAAE